MKKAILYLRVRTDNKYEQQTGWAEQEDILRRYCRDNEIKIMRIYRENHSAGGNFFNRPEFTKLYRYLKRTRSGVNLILFRNMDRFSRNVAKQIMMIDLLKRMGIKVQAAEQAPDLKQLIKKGFICKKQSCM